MSRHADHDRAAASRSRRPNTPIATACCWSPAAARCPRGRPPRPAGSISSCSAGTGRPSGWSSPSPARARSTPRSRSTRSSTARATTGTSASTACPRSSATATGSTGPQDDGHRYDPRIILHDPYTRALSCGRPWGTGDGLPRRSLMIESTIDRERRVNPRTPLEDTIIYELHVRGYTVDPSSGVRYPGTYPRPRREDRVPQGAGDHRRRAAARRRVRRERLPVRQSPDRRAAPQLLGLQPDRLLRPEGGLCPQPRAIGALAGILRDGRVVPRRGDRGLSRRRLQPHRRRGRRRADLQLPRHRQHALLHARRTGPLPELQRVRQHVQQRPPGRPQLPAGLPAELGRRGGRRRLPLRPGLGAGPRPARQRAGRAAGDQADLGGLAAAATPS